MMQNRISHYRIEKKIQWGGLGETYLALDQSLGRTVCVNLLPPSMTSNAEARRQLLEEARIAAQLQHPNIITLYEVVQSEEETCLVTEYVSGRTLDEMVGRKAFSPDEALDVGRQVASGLIAAHEAGIVFLNLTPANILMTPRRQIKIMDVGLGVAFSRVLHQEHMTLARLERGANPYMAPEQLLGKEADARTDLYSLGAIMFHLTTGRLPHDASGQVAMIDAILKEPAPNPRNYNPDVPPRLGRVIGGLLEKDPRNRIQSAGELLEELQGGPEGLQRTGRTIGERLYSLKDEIRESILDITTMLRIPSGSRRDEKQREGVGEREEPEGAKTTEKVENSLKPLPRFVNAWFEGREPILPLEVGISYKFKVNIGARREAETSQAAEFGEPDFGNKDALMLLVSFFSEDFAIDRKTRQRPLKLLKIGDSEAVETMVSPLHQGACRIEIAISLQVELDLLQTLDFEVQAVEATVAQSMGD